MSLREAADVSFGYRNDSSFSTNIFTRNIF